MLTDITPLIIAGLLIVITILLYKIRNLSQEINNLKRNKIIDTPEGYENFVAESREWAFGYIEQVQTNLLDLLEVTKSLDNPSRATREDLLQDRAIMVESIDGIIKDLMPTQINER